MPDHLAHEPLLLGLDLSKQLFFSLRLLRVLLLQSLDLQVSLVDQQSHFSILGQQGLVLLHQHWRLVADLVGWLLVGGFGF